MKTNIEETIQQICRAYNYNQDFMTFNAEQLHDLALSHVALQKELSQIKTMIEESASKGRETIERIERILP
jgi:hypothetical protein